MYSVVNPTDRREFYDADKSELFPTKEELLKSLQYESKRLDKRKG